MKRRLIYGYLLALLVGGGVGYLYRSYMHLSTNPFVIWIPVVVGLGAVWLYGRIKDKKKVERNSR